MIDTLLVINDEVIQVNNMFTFSIYLFFIIIFIISVKDVILKVIDILKDQ